LKQAEVRKLALIEVEILFVPLGLNPMGKQKD